MHLPPCLLRRAFSLTELLIVIALIVLILALAIPAFSFITGSRSIDGAVNQVSAYLGRARSEAIGLQEARGVFFFIDPATQRINVAMVQGTAAKAGDNTNVDYYLNIVPDTDFLSLPPGVSLQMIDDCAFVNNQRQDDGYIGFNKRHMPNGSNETAAAYGGVILFDGNGQLISRTYAFRASMPDVTNTLRYTTMGKLLYSKQSKTDLDPVDGGDTDVLPAQPANVALYLRTQFGFVLFDRQTFETRGYSAGDPQIDTTMTAYGTNSPEYAEEQWLDSDATPVLINRYNGTVVRGE